jgi:hypothetical protein
MENINACVISDFSGKIHFVLKKPVFNLDLCLKIAKTLNKSLSANYLQDHVNKGIESKLIDTTINQKLKVKICILAEVIVVLMYDAIIDIHYLNLVSQRMIEGLYNLAKTRKLKIELLQKKYQEVCALLDDCIYMLDPRMRLGVKNEALQTKDMVGVI